MLLSRGKILSAMAGLAMLAIPVSALAGHRQDNFRAARPFAQHDQGFHNGWGKHPGPIAPEPFARPVYRQPLRQFMPAPQPIGWNGGWHEEAEEHEWHPAPQNYWAHPPVQAPYAGCEADGDNCRQNQNYRWRSDDVPQYQPSYENEDDNYGGQPYSSYTAPSTYNPVQRLNWLITRRQHAMFVIAQMRARGDSRGAGRMALAVNRLTTQINALQRQIGYSYNGTNYGYTPSSYSAPTNPFLGALNANSGYYGAPNNNPALNAVAAVVGPMLGLR